MVDDVVLDTVVRVEETIVDVCRMLGIPWEDVHEEVASVSRIALNNGEDFDSVENIMVAMGYVFDSDRSSLLRIFTVRALMIERNEEVTESDLTTHLKNSIGKRYAGFSQHIFHVAFCRFVVDTLPALFLVLLYKKYGQEVAKICASRSFHVDYHENIKGTVNYYVMLTISHSPKEFGQMYDEVKKLLMDTSDSWDNIF